MLKHVRIVVLMAAMAGLVSGCIFSPDPGKKPPPPPPPPQQDTPEHAMLRFIWAYENKKSTEYENMFTGDYTFEFATIDPTLQQKWSTGWFKEDEVIAATHLFVGGTNLAGETLPAATSITLTLAKTLPIDDTEGHDPTLFKVLSTSVDGSIEVPDPKQPDGKTTYVMSGNFHKFYLVRGDAATGLSSSEPADSVHWYIWRWQDQTQQLGAPTSLAGSDSPLPTPTTWGQIKATTR